MDYQLPFFYILFTFMIFFANLIKNSCASVYQLFLIKCPNGGTDKKSTRAFFYLILLRGKV